MFGKKKKPEVLSPSQIREKKISLIEQALGVKDLYNKVADPGLIDKAITRICEQEYETALRILKCENTPKNIQALRSINPSDLR